LEGAPGVHSFSVSRVDLASDTESARVVVEHRADTHSDFDNFCCGPQGMTAGAGSVWVADTTSKDVYRIDPATNTVIATIPAPAGSQACGDVVFDGSAIWVASSCDVTTIWNLAPAAHPEPETVMLKGSSCPL